MDQQVPREISRVFPKHRQDVLRWDGWGYKDSKFVYKNGAISFVGDRYPISGSRLDNFRDWITDMFNLDPALMNSAATPPTEFPKPLRNENFLTGLKEAGVEFSEDGMDRMMRCHGQTLTDIESLRKHKYKRLPDVVIWPNCHEQVVKTVEVAAFYNIALIPVGGNTSVSLASTTPLIYDRTIGCLDMTQMNRMLWLSEKNLTACFETGIAGQDIERELGKHGFMLGHEPDSYEFSTLGGWIATRASGMKKNRYGNIEDIVVRIKMVTGKGVLEKQCTAPRVSVGPDFNHVIFGSEGTLGVATEAVVKIRRIPDVIHYESLVFGSLETGVRFLREVAEKRLQPASIRLMDNTQFKCGVLLDPKGSFFTGFYEFVKRFYLTTICGFEIDRIAVATLLFEGDAKSVAYHEEQIIRIAKKYGGVGGGEKNGKKGYMLTFVVAYIRDFAWDLNIVGESFETSVAWDKCLLLCTNVRACIEREVAKREIRYFVVSTRVTQSYDDGACVYFYLLFKHLDVPEDSLKLFMEIEEIAREEILACGGTLSHHHGVGKLRSKWYPACVSEVGVGLYGAIKNELDPKNIFAAGNLVRPEDLKARL
ncbi:alkyldihydroxyacetonephosphate synthase-like [Toxorhynchites rutilus septentrionalis]|uniref:alkyldihydroxyacetonephosphate synthase-like n=1 Tax=Toxorhynchites rutilus septentrionalis TaxID=329112 RepID=UPI00247A672A|nr:alkyldihydroxyacetonephosphate synthase-like [Toxorhynchites rutilus septentrionalis]